MASGRDRDTEGSVWQSRHKPRLEDPRTATLLPRVGKDRVVPRPMGP